MLVKSGGVYHLITTTYRFRNSVARNHYESRQKVRLLGS